MKLNPLTQNMTESEQIDWEIARHPERHFASPTLEELRFIREVIEGTKTLDWLNNYEDILTGRYSDGYAFFLYANPAELHVVRGTGHIIYRNTSHYIGNLYRRVHERLST